MSIVRKHFIRESMQHDNEEHYDYAYSRQNVSDLGDPSLVEDRANYLNHSEQHLYVGH